MAELSMTQYIQGSEDDLYNYIPFRHCLEDHLRLLRSNAKPTSVDPMDAYRFRYDLSAYLRHKGVPFHLHYIVMRVNDMYYNYDFDESTTYLLIPDEDSLSNIANIYSATYS